MTGASYTLNGTVDPVASVGQGWGGWAAPAGYAVGMIGFFTPPFCESGRWSAGEQPHH